MLVMHWWILLDLSWKSCNYRHFVSPLKSQLGSQRRDMEHMCNIAEWDLATSIHAAVSKNGLKCCLCIFKSKSWAFKETNTMQHRYNKHSVCFQPEIKFWIQNSQHLKCDCGLRLNRKFLTFCTHQLKSASCHLIYQYRDQTWFSIH